MKNLMRMIILNFGRVTIKFKPYAFKLKFDTAPRIISRLKIKGLLVSTRNLVSTSEQCKVLPDREIRENWLSNRNFRVGRN
jgi:hypothetical protein